MSTLVIDFETTGLVNPSPVEFASITIPPDFSDELDWDYCQTFILPDKPVEWSAMGVHRITNEFLEENHDVKWADLKDNGYWVGENVEYLVAHNAQYDLQFIPKAQIDRVKVVCTLKLSRLLIDKSLCGDHKNSTLYYYLGCYKNPFMVEHLSKSHSALHDCVVTANVLITLLEKFNLTIEQAYEMLNTAETVKSDDNKANTFNGDYKTCYFAKHKGKQWSRVVREDADYVRWLIREGKIRDEATLTYINKLINKLEK